MNNIIAFADEYGTNSFDFDSQGTHFIVASVIVPKDKLPETEAEIERIRRKYFQTGEIKSSGVAGNHKRRLILLQELVKAEFSVYAVVVDKRKLQGEGFKYKGSFYKYMNGLVYRELYRTFPNLELVVDEHGSNGFMRGFKKYVFNNHIPSLFDSAELRFTSSPASVMIQLADFIAGTLGRCFDESKKTAESLSFLTVLQPKISSISYFPPASRAFDYSASPQDQAFDITIAELAVNRARGFIDSKEIRSQEDTDQVNCVKLLLLYFNTFSHRRYVSTKELIRHLNVNRADELKEHYFRTKVIGKLRDVGVLIASSSSGDKKGYKLPSSVEDLQKFVNHGKSMIIPLLSRIEKSRDAIRLVTQNTVDILDKPEFKELRELLDKREAM